MQRYSLNYISVIVRGVNSCKLTIPSSFYEQSSSLGFFFLITLVMVGSVKHTMHGGDLLDSFLD